MKTNRKVATAAVGTLVLTVLVAATGTSASAAALITGKDIKDNSITSVDIAAGGIGSSELRDGTVNPGDLSTWTKKYIAAQAGEDGVDGTNGVDGAPGTDGIDGTNGVDGAPGVDGTNGTNGVDGVDGEDAFVDSDTESFEPKVIAQLGGSWTRHTKVGEVTLPAGDYLLTVNSGFWKSSATTATPSLQVQLNTGVEAGKFPTTTHLTTFTGSFPAGGKAGERSAAGVLEQTTSGFALVSLAEETTIEVDAFGYNPDSSSNGSGAFSVDVDLSWVQVNGS